ncbi:MAG: mechanosensitive ion channel domain-containing protein, partial [Burkholderiales bacterium]
METISIERLLPELVTLTVALGLLWLLFWLITRALQRWFASRAGDGNQPGAVEAWAARLTLFLRRVTAGASLIIAVLIMVHGLGVRGVPELTWDRIALWVRGSGLPLLFIAGSALVLIRAASIFTKALPDALVPERLAYAERMDRRKQVATRARLGRWLFSAVVLGTAAIMVLRQLGVDTTPLLAGGAIVSVALGFGAQNLVRDIIGGVFMIIENQLRVGDIASINGKSGVVEAIRLRTTTLRSLDGTVHVIQNGLVTDLSNMTMNFSFAVIELGVAYKEDVDTVMDLLRVIGTELQADPVIGAKLLAPLEVLGVEDF